MSSSTEYRHTHQSGHSPEPLGRKGRRGRRATRRGPSFVIQHHASRSDHYDFRLEIDGVLVSWAVPKGPSTDPQCATFEGVIPNGECGAGPEIVWDGGTYTNETQRAMAEGLDSGHLSFSLRGEKLQGGYALTRMRQGEDDTWLLVKRRDE